jgi:1,4-alpha-glucan branching enzyme
MREPRIEDGEPTLLTEEDLWLFGEGSHTRLYEVLGAHPITVAGKNGTLFAVWAPEAKAVSVVGDFNLWDPRKHRMRPHRRSGIWECFVPGISPGALYKYHLTSRHGPLLLKADPFAFYSEISPRSASVVRDLSYRWGDARWLRERGGRNALDAPIAVYEIHLGSWRRKEDGRSLTYRELAPLLSSYVQETGFTHVEFLPVMEHPFYGSWGYQTTGYFAPTSRYGPPQEFMYLVNHLHQHGIGVILDWVPSHFATDGHGLGRFDGSHLYEHADPKRGIHPDWGSFTFNYDRHEVRSFLLSSALFWLDVYHADGLRLDAVASMLYLDYSRKEGEWVPNERGGREDLAAIRFLRQLNEAVYREYPDVQTFAEESTAWPMVSRPTSLGGLGFGLKWDMGWMHDTLVYMAKDPIYRAHHHDKLTFRMLYAGHENFVLPLSHDEVVHGKGSLLTKMPGDDWQKFANLRLVLGYMYAGVGKKLLFMGGEIGQWGEWDHERVVEWSLLDHSTHRGVQQWLADLNRLYRTEPALYRRDCGDLGFQWVEPNDATSSAIAFLRWGRADREVILAVGNFTPVVRTDYRVGVPHGGRWSEILNSDAKGYGGSGQGNLGGVKADTIPCQGFPQSLSLTLPPLAMLFFKPATG